MKKSLLKISIMLMIFLMIFSMVVQANITSGYNFGITNQRSDGENTYIYAFESKNNGLEYVWNVQRKNNSIAVAGEVYYCLAHGYGNFSQFNSNVGGTPLAVGGDSASSYSGAYKLKDNGVIDTINSVYSGTDGNTLNGTKYNSILWILDHMYMAGENKNEFFKKIPWHDDGTFGLDEYSNVYEVMNLTTANSDDNLSTEDLEVIQQLAIWHFTNPESITTFPTIKIAVNGGSIGTYEQVFTSSIGETQSGTLRNYYAKMVYEYLVNGGEQAVADSANLYKGDNITTALAYINSEAQPVVRITREQELTGEYKVIVKKINKEGNPLKNAKFTINGTEYITGDNGTVETELQNITEANVNDTDTFQIIETEAPAGYIKYDGTINLSVTKKEATDGKSYVINTPVLDETSNNSSFVTMNYDTKTVTITIINERISGKYLVKINKQNEAGQVLKDATFTVNGQNYTTNEEGNAIIASNVEINEDNVNTPDIYSITEIKAPEGYKVYNGTISLTVTKKEAENTYVINEATLDETSKSSNRVRVEIDSANSTVTVIIIEEEIKGAYTVKINKQNEEGEVLKGATFTVNLNNDTTNNYTTDEAGFATLAENKEINASNLKVADEYKMTEIIAPEGYKVYNGEITLTVTKKQVGETYAIDEATLDETSKSSNRVKVEIDSTNNTVTVIIIEEKISGDYTVRINKQNQKGEVLQNAVFSTELDYVDTGKINKEITTDADGFATLIEKLKIDDTNLNRKDTYKIKELKAPTGYVVYDGEITLTVTKKQVREVMLLDKVEIDETSKASGKVTISIDANTNTVTVIIVEDNIDLSLRKFISKVTDGSKVEKYTNTQLSNRIPNVDTTKLVQKADTTAEYNHTKAPVPVSVGDLVTYTLRVYNEGESDAYITEVTDYLANYLKPVDNGEWYISYKTSEDDKFETKVVSSAVTTIAGASDNLSTLVGKTIGEGVLLPAFDKENNKLSYIDLEVTCEVMEPKIDDLKITDYKMTNIAEITGMLDKNKNVVDKDIDSEKNNINLPEDENKWENYKDEELSKNYIPGQQDDDDFEKITIIVPKYDLSLRKFISKVNDKEYDREPKVDTKSLKDGILDKSYGTATYIHSKEPVSVRRNDVVTYTIRVYNEGNVNAYVSEITDYLPEYLEFLEDDELNKKYDWKYDDNTRIIHTNITSKDAEDEYELFKNRENGKVLLKYDGGETLNYIDVQIRCRVKADSNAFTKQTNIAEITGITDVNNNVIKDVDSTPENVNVPEDKKLPEYKDDEMEKEYIPGQEDDDDFEKVIIKGDFDLALRKFITKVNTVSVNNRYPALSLDDNGKIKYTHTKNPVEVCYSDTVIYTLRVYNEGEIDGFANEITDDVPDGLEFIVDNEINKTYRWKLLDENYEETDDVSKAKYITTDYLSEEQGQEENRDNLIKAFNKEAGLTDNNPDYRDVQIAFKVTYKVTDPNEESRILVNVAQISKDSDDDIDSNPSRDEDYNEEDHEDDIDYEQVKVKYFDLSLLKWVSKVIVVEKGNTTVTNTGHTGDENPEPVVKVEIKSQNVNSVVVKFGYTIKITNEGEIAGYAKEVTDYIPKGLKFVAEDNPDWYVREDGKVATKQLENTLLQPGEKAEVEIVLTWINGEKNLGTKINIAEISEDDNPSKTPDIDSTPDNEKPEEDDIDDAPVMLVIKTGLDINPQYSILAGVVLVILVTGTVLIKKFVL